MNTQRINPMRAEMAAVKTDAFLLVNHEQSGQPATRYISGFLGTESVLMITKKRHYIIVDGRYYVAAKTQAPLFTLLKRDAPLNQLLKNLFATERIKTVLIDGSHTHYSFVENLKRVVKIQIKSDPELLHRIRIIKDNEEIQYLQKAADISVIAFKRLLPRIKPGVTELWLAAQLELLMKESGSGPIAFDSIVASGENGAKPHAKPTTKKIKKGELITFDFGASYAGYMSDITRTVAVGALSPKWREIYETVQKSQELGCKTARAGITGAELDNVCREYIDARGYGKYFLHSTGHGLGMQVHELP